MRVQGLDQALQDLRLNGWSRLGLDIDGCAAYRRMVDHANWFFDQPTSEKRLLDIRASVGHRGWVPPEEAGSYADEGSRRYESFDIGREANDGDRIDHFLRGTNKWPQIRQGRVLAADATVLFNELAALAKRIGDAICADLGVDPDELRRLRTEPVSQLRLIRYFAHDGAPIDLTDTRPAMGAHTDYEFFTLLFQSAPGTQVLDQEGTWLDVPHERSVTLLTGDMLTVFSNGRYRSVLHRACPSVAPGRISIPFFAGADYCAEVRSVVEPSDKVIHFGRHLRRQLERDFPYLRKGETGIAVDLTDRDRRSAFETEAWQRYDAQDLQPVD